MLKKLELSDPNSCLNKAADDEIVFVLRAKDPSFAATVRFWAGDRVTSRVNAFEDAKIQSALADARNVEAKMFVDQIQASNDAVVKQNKCQHEFDAMNICRHCGRRKSDIVAAGENVFDGTYPLPANRTAGRKEAPPPGSA